MAKQVKFNPEIYHQMRLPYSLHAVEFIKERVNYSNEFHVLDLGSGTGLLLEHFIGGKLVVGADRSFEMLEYATQRSNLSGTQMIQALAEAVPLTDKTFDLVILGHVIHWVDIDKCFNELRRILKPGGWLVTISRYPSPSEPFRPLYLYLLDKWANRKNYKPHLLKVEDEGVGYIAGLEDFGFISQERYVFEELVVMDIDDYLQKGKDHQLYTKMTEVNKENYLLELRQMVLPLTINNQIQEHYYDYLYFCQLKDG